MSWVIDYIWSEKENNTYTTSLTSALILFTIRTSFVVGIRDFHAHISEGLQRRSCNKSQDTNKKLPEGFNMCTMFQICNAL